MSFDGDEHNSGALANIYAQRARGGVVVRVGIDRGDIASFRAADTGDVFLRCSGFVFFGFFGETSAVGGERREGDERAAETAVRRGAERRCSVY